MRLLLPLLAGAALAAVEPATAAALPPDPSAAVVAEGAFRYRARDVEALVLIAKRHAKQRLTTTQEDALRQVLVRALPAREALLSALNGLPMEGAARDALILDLLAYQAEPTPVVVPKAGAPAASSAGPAASSGPVLVSLPALPVTRTIGGKVRTLTIGLALMFPDQATADRLSSQAPVLQDALLGAAQALPDGQLTAPSQAEIRQAFLTAIKARLPDFPADGLLVPRLEAGE